MTAEYVFTVPAETNPAKPGTHEYHVSPTGKTGWHKITDVDGFVKWQYADSPYRVVAHLREDRGHWEALFTSWYDGPSHLIRGNCSGGPKGRMLATAAAQQFMTDNATGCSPPSEYK